MLTEDERLRKSAVICARVEAMPCFSDAVSVLMYWSMPGEVHTHALIKRWSTEKKILLPVIDGNNLRLVLFEGEQSLRKNAGMNLYEPTGSDCPLPVELAIVPGIAFDRNNNRMGRGRGFYDRLLPHLQTHSIGVCFDFQLFDAIPFDKYDAKVDEIVTG